MAPSTVPDNRAGNRLTGPGSTKTTSLFPSMPYLVKIFLNINAAMEATPVVAILPPLRSLRLLMFGLTTTHWSTWSLTANTVLSGAPPLEMATSALLPEPENWTLPAVSACSLGAFCMYTILRSNPFLLHVASILRDGQEDILEGLGR